MPYKNKEERRKYDKEWRRKNRDKLSKYNKQWHKNNPGKIKKYNENWVKNNRIKKLECMRKWRKNNAEHTRSYAKQWRRDNPEKIKQYRKENLEKSREYSRKYWENNPEIKRNYERRKRDTSLKFNLNHKIKREIQKVLKGNKKGRSWESLTGYNLADLKKRLNETMPAGYTWQDFLSGELHIDHIIPISAFNFTRPEHTDFKRCWALSNLRLLPAKENLIKSNHLIRPFQPALRI